MKTVLALVAALSISGVAVAQTPTPPPAGSSPAVFEEYLRSVMKTDVERKDAGAVSHLKVSLTVPPATESLPAYTRAFFYGWIVTADGNKLNVSQCTVSDSCPYGFPAKSGPFNPGDRATFEIDVPKSFVDAEGASLQMGIGGKSYYPTRNLLTIAHVATVPAPVSTAVMTPELMARVIQYTRDLKGTGALSSKVCRALNLCDGTADMVLKLAKSDATDCDHDFGLPVDASSKDILFLVQRPGSVEAYLTDKTGALRAAAVLENGSAHVIPNEKAAAKFKAELSLFAGEAAALPAAAK